MDRRTWRGALMGALGLVALGGAVAPAAAAGPSDSIVSSGSPTTPFSQNKQNEPAIAADANHPNVLAAGSNDNIDLEACNAGDPTTCPFTPGVGVSGIYFSSDSGSSWTQPTYTGLTARGCLGPQPCTPQEGPIGTLPWYFENGLSSGGDPALAFGPRPDASGHFSWANGSRLYYANLAASLSSGGGRAFNGFEAVAISRTDDVAAAAAGGAAGKAAWMPPVIASKQSSSDFSDKEQVWADNASSSSFFGTAYVCYVQFRSKALHRQANAPAPLTVLVSHDGGSTWSSKQLVPASTAPSNNNGQSGFGITGCTVRTDSTGRAYVFGEQFAASATLPTHSHHVMFTSADGGTSWSNATPVQSVVDPCFFIDPVLGRCVEDGVAGARNDLAASPSVDIANGAPSGTDATNLIVDSWADGRDGQNREHVMLSSSKDGGATWSSPTAIESRGDRGYYAAPALSPNGTDVYVVYNAYTTPFRTETTSPRSLVGVVLHADVTAMTPGPFAELHRGRPGDPRGSSQNNLAGEFLGDYVYAIATRTYGAGVWNDVRNAADCPAIDAWRMSLRTGSSVPRPAPNSDCPATFGNSDIFGASELDPTP